MRFFLLVVIGLGLMVAGVALTAGGVYDLAQVGTCATGGAYAIAQECPDGMGIRVAKLFGGIIATLIGFVMLAGRGAHKDGTGGTARGTGAIAGAVWGMWWLGMAAAIWLSMHGEGAVPNENGTVATVLAITFATMGAIPLLGSILAIIVGRRPTPNPVHDVRDIRDMRDVLAARLHTESGTQGRDGGDPPRDPT